MAKRKKLTDWQKAYGINASKSLASYRSGKKKPVTLAPIFKNRERDELVGGCMDVMRDWNVTPFENEGTARAGLRASLCLRGHSWPRSDLESALIVEKCLSRLGASRPSWEAGQPEYTIPVEYCAWCAGEKDPVVRGRFCGTECAKAFAVRRQECADRRNIAIYQNAMRVVRRSHKDRRDCRQCGQQFMHDGEKDPRQFCSHTCYGLFMRSDAAVSFDCVCVMCDSRFKAKHADRIYCSNSCQLTESRLRTGKNVPKRLSRVVFDYVFTRVVDEERARERLSNVVYLTPEHFDRAFAGQKSIPTGNAFTASEAFDRLFG